MEQREAIATAVASSYSRSSAPCAAEERAKSFLVSIHVVLNYTRRRISLLQDILVDLPRPHSLVPDEDFLHHYSLEAQYLTLRDIVKDSSIPE